MPGAPPDFSYPFYYNLVTELPGMKVSPTTLAFYDKPSDRCLPGGANVNTPDCLGTMEPAGSYGGYTTHLAGVTSIGGAVDLNVGFVWRSNYNGTTGGVNVRKTLIPDTPLDGTGEATITSTDDITDYDYNGLEVTAVNGQPVTALDIPVMPPWALAALAATLFAIALVVLRTR